MNIGQVDMPLGESFTGSYHSQQLGDVFLGQTGADVTGTYQYDRAACRTLGRLEGRTAGNLLRFTWTEDQSLCGRFQPISGHGYMLFWLERNVHGVVNGRLDGEWGMGDAELGNGHWSAFRDAVRRQAPARPANGGRRGLFDEGAPRARGSSPPRAPPAAPPPRRDLPPRRLPPRRELRGVTARARPRRGAQRVRRPRGAPRRGRDGRARDAVDAPPDASPDARPDAPPTSPPAAPAGRRRTPTPRCRCALRRAPRPALRVRRGRGRARDWYAPCDEAPRLLLVRTLAAWSGALAARGGAHTRRVLEHPQGAAWRSSTSSRSGLTTRPPPLGDLAAWRARYDAAPAALAVDPEYRFGALYGDAGELPLYVAVDPRTMRVLAAVARPPREALASVITQALAQIDGLPRSTRFPRHPPRRRPLHRRRVGDDPGDDAAGPRRRPTRPTGWPTTRARRGWARRSSRTRAFRTRARWPARPATSPRRATPTASRRAVGFEPGDRNTPSVLGAAHARWLFWDGRADTLWAQALGPIENPLEMASTRLAVAHRVAAATPPPTPRSSARCRRSRTARASPARGMPGDPRWEAMRPDDRDAVDRVFANVGKALAAYERTLRYAPSALDRYAAGDLAALTETQRDGLTAFFAHGCAQCHHGPMLTDDSFHNVGMPTGRADRQRRPGPHRRHRRARSRRPSAATARTATTARRARTSRA